MTTIEFLNNEIESLIKRKEPLVKEYNKIRSELQLINTKLNKCHKMVSLISRRIDHYGEYNRTILINVDPTKQLGMPYLQPIRDKDT